MPLESFDPAKDCPRWMEFLNHATGGDTGVMRFLAKWAGYNLTGDTREEALLFIHGPSGSRKSTWVNTLAAILGDYDTAVASETERDRTWAKNRVKELTGGDTMTGRFMREETFEFKPQLKLTIVGNNRPNPTDRPPVDWSRLKLALALGPVDIQDSHWA